MLSREEIPKDILIEHVTRDGQTCWNAQLSSVLAFIDILNLNFSTFVRFFIEKMITNLGIGRLIVIY
jgi:hypothetical protein